MNKNQIMQQYSFEEIVSFVKQEISQRKEISVADIDVYSSLDDFAFDSINVVGLAGSLGEKLSLEIEPTLLLEFDSIEKMVMQLEILHQKGREAKISEGTVNLDINIVASFTSEPIAEFLNYWLSLLSYQAKINFAAYNQVFQEILNSGSSLYRNPKAENIILLRIEDWFRFEKGKVETSKIEKTLEEFITALETATQRDNLRCIFVLCPHSQASTRKLGLSEIINQLDEQIINSVKKLPNITLLDVRDLSQTYTIGKVFDEARDKMGHIPFSQEFFAVLGTKIARRIYASQYHPLKVIVLDCDNTLWRGICGEDGYLGVQITPEFANFQKQMLAHKDNGFLLCLCSKNNEKDAWEVFEKNPYMLIKREDIVSSKINWNRKSQNLIELAEELQLALDSFIFIDDNLAECTEVKMSCPEVLVISVPKKQENIPSFFENHWAFDVFQTTAEDQKRTVMYQQNQQRQKMRSNISNFDDFLAALNVQINISCLDENSLERASQITHRTNQFNATTIRRTQQEIKAIIQSEKQSIVRIDVQDKFGDYGFVGMMIYELQDNSLECETFLMSCRVLGKRVEHGMIRYLATEAEKHQINTVRLNFKSSEKNKPIEDFFLSLQKPFIETENNTFKIEFNTTEIDKLLSRIKKSRPPQKEEKILPNPNKINNLEFTIKQYKALNYIAESANDLSSLMKNIHSSARIKRPQLSTKYIAPRTTWQRNIGAIWREVLHIDKIGIYDNFYELGGDSLKSAEVFAKMWDLGIPESVSLQTIPEPTVAGLSQAIEDVKQGRKASLLVDRFSLEDEGKLPEDLHNEGYDVTSYSALMQNIFLTGGTGYVGAFLISELFIQSNETNIIALVRAATKEKGRNRIKRNLQRYDLWKDSYDKRLDICLGDLTEPLFGLDEKEFNHLGKQIDTIFHSGAWVNFVYPYQHLKAANVDSVETILRLAVSNKPRPIQVHFISTLGVIMSYGYPKNIAVYETEELAHCEGLLNGYEQSKYVGDKMVWSAMKDRGIPANMYRPGMVSGLSDSGVYHKLDEFLPSFLKGCIQMKSWPLLDTTWEIVPIDYISKAIVHIALNPKNLNKAYFSLHPKSRMVKDFIDWHNEFGYPVRALPWDIWKKEFLSQGEERLKNNALFPFIDFIRALSEEQIYFPTTDKSNFMGNIKDLKLECPDQLVLMERYTKYFIDVGYYDSPSNTTV